MSTTTLRRAGAMAAAVVGTIVCPHGAWAATPASTTPASTAPAVARPAPVGSTPAKASSTPAPASSTPTPAGSSGSPSSGSPSSGSPSSGSSSVVGGEPTTGPDSGGFAGASPTTSPSRPLGKVLGLTALFLVLVLYASGFGPLGGRIPNLSSRPPKASAVETERSA
ncbi:MAG TPA: hypothetical protein VE990_12215 [Acidimicrobiales bacterium]|nr:hypothetical protein [Acidimicrobiales bacterium]